MKTSLRLSLLAVALLGAGCATLPSGPSVMVLPGSTKSFDQFRADDAECRRYASGQVGGSSPTQTANDANVRSAVAGTAIGAAAGAAFNGGSGAAVGAGLGLLMGSMIGSGYGEESGYGVQRRYDVGYTQCMYSYGHKVPSNARYTNTPSVSQPVAPVAPASATIPPPPPGSPPPPPPR